MAKNNKKDRVYGYAAFRHDGRVKGFYFGKHKNALAWLDEMLGKDQQVKIVFGNGNGCGYTLANDEHLPVNAMFPPHRGTLILQSSVAEIQKIRNSVGGDADYYDMLDDLASKGVPVYV